MEILGAGPAGSAAAISARLEGAPVRLIEKSKLPRHKVCGEFLSPEIVPALEELRLLDEFLGCRPARIDRLVLHFGHREKRCRLPERAFGLSRYRLDQLLWERAIGLGAEQRQAGMPTLPQVMATGRSAVAPHGNRLFGFKAHFRGLASDAIELFFFEGGYVGIAAVEDAITNVCGLAREPMLRSHNFDVDRVLRGLPPLSERLRPLSRAMDWLTVGPLVFQNRLRGTGEEGTYPAGDALSFVDPFTGSGILSAILTGRLAGLAAARQLPVSVYLQQCRRILERPFEVASLFRAVLRRGWADWLAGVVPATWLFHLTRPQGLRAKS